jgi:hypothetical protein
MKKTIASLVILAATSSAHALVPMDLASSSSSRRTPPPPKPRTICLETYQQNDGSLSAADCDSTQDNIDFGRALKENGCAEGQVSIVTYDIKVSACTNVIQL